MRYSRRDFIKTASISAAALATGCGRSVLSRNHKGKRKAVILGFDGMDPVLLQRFVKEGLMPNAARIMASGGFSALGTSDPPQSPVAWANVITGADSGVHGIYDFIARDPRTLAPYLSTARTPDTVGNLSRNRFGRFFLREPGIRNLRQGVAFWDVLEEAGIPCTILRMPSDFPPGKTSARTLSGMGTPDIQGAYGVFTFFTDKRGSVPDEVSGGRIERVTLGTQGHAQMELQGPRVRAGNEGDVSRVAFDVWVDRDQSAARIRLQGADFILREKEWSEWVSVGFRMEGIPRAQGICRFFLKSASGPFELYASPVNMDPGNPTMPISSPASYASDIAGRIGPFYTQGMAEDTSALSAGVFDDDLFRNQSDYVLDESLRMFESEFSRYREGLFFFYFSSLDQNQHAFWRAVDKTHPLYHSQLASRHGDYIPSLYRRLDAVLGRVLEAEGPETLVMAISDHGFGCFRRQFHLNRWLLDNGYASGPGESGADFYDGVLNGESLAYGLGINSLYVNLRGREPAGRVRQGAERDALREELARRLLAVTDPRDGRRVIRRVLRPEDVYTAPRLEHAPDLIIGYDSGYRASWDTVLGCKTREHVSDNLDTWSGDHCTDAALVSGVLLANRKVIAEAPCLMNVASTLLHAFDVPVPPSMRGLPVLAKE